MRAAHLLGPHGGEEVGLVVVGDGEHGVRAVDPCLVQKLHRQAVAVQHDRALERIGREFGAGAVASR